MDPMHRGFPYAPHMLRKSDKKEGLPGGDPLSFGRDDRI